MTEPMKKNASEALRLLKFVLFSASAGVPTPYGEAVLRWVHRYGSRYVYLQVPFGTTAVVTLPGLGTFEAGSGFHHWELPE